MREPFKQRVFQVCSHSPLAREPPARRRGRVLGRPLESHRGPDTSGSGWVTWEVEPFQARGKSVLKVVVAIPRCHLCEEVDWMATSFDGVFVEVVSWLNSSLIKVEWEELTALCVSHLLSAFIGRNSQ